MPTIPIYSDAPIAPQTATAKADGGTPQTATQELQIDQTPTRTTAAPTSSTTSSSPPAPQPGARPIAPTQSASAGNSARTGAFGGSADLPARPGQAPSAVTASAMATPAATENSASAGSYRGVVSPPPQFSIPPPTINASATHSTQTSTSSLSKTNAGQTTLNLGAAVPPPPSASSQFASPPAAAPTGTALNLAHPPGYVQNPYAADGTPEQRERLVAGAKERQLDGDSGDASGGIWGSVVAAAAKVGEGLKKGEEEAWRLAGVSKGK